MGRPMALTPEQREHLLKQGFRPVEVWVPDDHDKSYLAEAARQAREAARADSEDNVMVWIDAASDGVWDDK